MVELLLTPFNLTRGARMAGARADGALVLQANDTAAMLLPPLTFSFTFKTRRADPDAKVPTELVVTGQFATLVYFSAKKATWDFDEKREGKPKDKEEKEERELQKFVYKKAMGRALRALDKKDPAPLVPAGLLAWLGGLGA